jgi:hypothetical protein
MEPEFLLLRGVANAGEVGIELGSMLADSFFTAQDVICTNSRMSVRLEK